MQSAYRALEFEKINLLVHPFFALENLHRGIATSGLKPSPREEVIKNYEFLGLINSWREKILQTKRNPSAILILVGVVPRMRYGLTKKEFLAFSEQYQSLLKFAKRNLGRRAIIVSESIKTKRGYLDQIFSARNLFPKKKILVSAFGEYLSNPKDGEFCVRGQARLLKELFKEKFPKTRISNAFVEGTGQRMVSLPPTDFFPAAEFVRETRRRGFITPEFIEKRIDSNMYKLEQREKFARTWNTRPVIRKRVR